MHSLLEFFAVTGFVSGKRRASPTLQAGRRP